MLRHAILASLLATPLPASAMGFHAKDLWGIRLPTADLLGGTYTATSHTPNRVTLRCTDCGERVVIDIQITRGEHAAEARLRSGLMTLAGQQKGCSAWAEACRHRGHKVGPAIGWVQDYTLPGQAGTTARIYLDGDMLTIRSTAVDPAIAHGNARAVLDRVAPAIVTGD
ncbi:MAG: hypothetical protein AAGB15_00370 [Pseudomonadota bacterium]